MLLPAMSPLEILIRNEIDQSGPMPFARFMQLALYCPELGFYDRFPHRIGARGDFYTSVSVGSLFGQLLAAQFSQWLHSLPEGRWQLIEAGAHDGRLADDLLNWFQQHDKPLLDRLEYVILEPSIRRRGWQEANLTTFQRNLRWVDDVSDVGLSAVQGVVFANEFLDALPVHRLGWDCTRRSWFEWGVGVHRDQFRWIRLPLDRSLTAVVPEVPAELAEQLPDGFSTEVCPAATDWWGRAAGALAEGWLLTFDYGLRSEEFFDPGRAQGTLRAYHRHRVNGELLARPGEQDLTAHLNFTALERAGLQEGLQTESWTTQGRFLTGIVAGMVPDRWSGQEWSLTEFRQFQSLTHPDHLGARHQVLVQTRSQG
jgi:SAM-dependent MidA family methyltransferase